MFPLSYVEGAAPTTTDEVSLSSLAADALGAGVGDVVTLEGATGTHALTVVGTYQDMTNGGATAKALLPVEGEQIVWRTVLLDAADGVAPADLAARLQVDEPTVQTILMAEFADETLGDLAAQTGRLAAAAGVTALALATLVAAVMGQLGAPALRFDVDPLLAYGVVPLVLTAVVALVAFAATRSFDRLGVSQLTEE